MRAKTDTHAVEMVRRVRDEQASMLAATGQVDRWGAALRQAGEAARKDARRLNRGESSPGSSCYPPLPLTGSVTAVSISSVGLRFIMSAGFVAALAAMPRCAAAEGR